jgi:hypothetical protein
MAATILLEVVLLSLLYDGYYPRQVKIEMSQMPTYLNPNASKENTNLQQSAS